MLSEEPIIRQVRPDDIPAITAIYRPAVETGTASFELVAPTGDEMRARIQVITGGGYPYLVAAHADDVVGYAYASAYRTRPGYRFSVEDSVYVRPDQQGRGVGRLLLAELVRLTEAAGYRQMIAVIGDSRNAGSINLHRALGFTFSGTIHSVGFKHGRWLDSVIMQRTLGEGDATLPVSIR